MLSAASTPHKTAARVSTGFRAGWGRGREGDATAAGFPQPGRNDANVETWSNFKQFENDTKLQGTKTEWK